MKVIFKIFVSKDIREVSLENIAQMVIGLFPPEKHRVWYVEKNDLKIITIFLVAEERKLLENGDFLMIYVLTNIIFTKVNEYKRMIFYNHRTGKARYTNESEEVGEHPIIVLRYPDRLAESVANCIIKNKILRGVSGN